MRLARRRIQSHCNILLEWGTPEHSAFINSSKILVYSPLYDKMHTPIWIKLLVRIYSPVDDQLRLNIKNLLF